MHIAKLIFNTLPTVGLLLRCCQLAGGLTAHCRDLLQYYHLVQSPCSEQSHAVATAESARKLLPK